MSARRRCGLCGDATHNRTRCPKNPSSRFCEATSAKSAEAKPPTNVIRFSAAAAPLVVEKKIKASKRFLCIGDDLVATRQVYKAIADVQVETQIDEAMAVASSRKWDAFFICASAPITDREIKRLVDTSVPVLAVASKFDEPMWAQYCTAGVLGLFTTEDIDRGQVDLFDWLMAALDLKSGRIDPRKYSRVSKLLNEVFGDR